LWDKRFKQSISGHRKREPKKASYSRWTKTKKWEGVKTGKGRANAGEGAKTYGYYKSMTGHFELTIRGRNPHRGEEGK